MRERVLKSNNRNLYAFIICIVFAFVSIAFNVVYTEDQTEKDFSKVYDYNELISEGKDKEGLYVNFTFVSQPYLYASKETDSGKENCYLVYDKNQAFYIIRITDKTYDLITKEYINNKDNFSYKITGFIRNTPNDLKQITIEEFNKLFDKEILTEANFSKYFGNTYLDQTYSPTHAPTVILAIITFLSGITAIVFLIIYISSRKALKGINTTEVEAELMSPDTLEFKKYKVLLTNKYIVSKSSGVLKILEYDKIVWMYIQKRYYNGIPIGAFLTVATREKNHQIAVAKNETDLAEMMEVIFRKNDKILLGYTKENIDAYKELRKK